MSALDRLVLEPEPVLFAASVALAATVTSLVGCGLAWLCRRGEAPVRHAMLLTTVAVSIGSPLLLAIGSPVPSGWLRFPVETAASPSTPIESPIGPAERRAAASLSENVARSPEAAATKSATDALRPPAENASASSWLVAGSVLIGLWLAGVVVGAAGAVRGVLILRRFRRTLRAVPQSEFSAEVRSAFRSVGSDRDAPIYVTHFAPAPMSLGLLRPLIVVPEYLAVDSADERLRLVLTHEVAHVMRRDQWAALLQRVGGIVYWWNPLFRAVSRQLSQVREEICDDYVLQAEGEGRKFAATLLDVAERTAMAALPGTTSLLQDQASSLELRIQRLLTPRTTPMTRMNRRTMLATTLFGCLLSAIVLATRVQSEEFVACPQAPDATMISTAGLTERSVFELLRPSAWLLSLPAGFEHRVTLTSLGDSRYRLSPNSLNMSGIYELRGSELWLVEPNDSRLTEFRWHVWNHDTLLLVEEPAVHRTGARYAGAPLVRGVGLGDGREAGTMIGFSHHGDARH